jgi:hypothetical protein
LVNLPAKPAKRFKIVKPEQLFVKKEKDMELCQHGQALDNHFMTGS